MCSDACEEAGTDAVVAVGGEPDASLLVIASVLTLYVCTSLHTREGSEGGYVRGLIRSGYLKTTAARVLDTTAAVEGVCWSMGALMMADFDG